MDLYRRNYNPPCHAAHNFIMSLVSLFLHLKPSPISSLPKEISGTEMTSLISRKQLLFCAEKMKEEKYYLTTRGKKDTSENAKSITTMCTDTYIP
jgi:hypothetical protein